MKRVKLLSAFFVLFTAIGFVSCESEPVDPVLLDYLEELEEEEPEEFSFTVLVDGEEFSASASNTQAAIGDGLIVISAVSGTKTVQIAIPGTTVGAYSGDDVLMSYSPSLDPDDYSYLNIDPNIEIGGPDVDPTNGGIVISEIDTQNHTISGTFYFTGYWSDGDEEREPIELTEGVFVNLPYTGNLNTDPEPEEEFFTAVVDGEAVNFSVVLSVTSGNFITVSGAIVSPPQQIQLLLESNMTAGTYDIGGVDGVTGLYSEGTTAYTATSGSLTITTNDGNWIAGTFSFNGIGSGGETVVITDAEFHLEL